jgi:hypothetical protein
LDCSRGATYKLTVDGILEDGPEGLDEEGQGEGEDEDKEEEEGEGEEGKGRTEFIMIIDKWKLFLC